MPIYDLVCPAGHEQLDAYLKLGERPPCPVCGKATATLWRASANVIPDDIPGGILINHGICNDDGTPKRYYTKSSMLAAAAAKGLRQNASGLPDAKPNTKRVYFGT